MAKFEGIIPALITPFDDYGNIFYKGIKNEIEYLHFCGYKNVFACGSYGSFPLISIDQRIEFNKEVIKLCKEFGMKSIIHIGSTSTQDSILLAEYCENYGADAISSVVPYYYSSSSYNEKTFLTYFNDIISSVNIDVHIYNNPTTTGFNVTPEFFKKLIHIGIKGIKDGGSNMERILSMLNVIEEFNEEIEYYPSSTSSLITGFLLGCKACISGVSLSSPELVMKLYNNMMKKNYDEAVILYKKIMKIRKILGEKSSRAISAYSILNLSGVNVGICKLPWIPLSKYDSEIIYKKIEGIIDNE